MNILVIGGGGREHALAWKLAQSPRVGKVFVAPGNAGTAREPGLTNVALTDDRRRWSRSRRASGRADGRRARSAARRGRRRRVPRRGPHDLRPDARGGAARKLEGLRQGVHGAARHPDRASIATFTDAAAAHAYVDARGAPIVVKADGLAAGKGVVVAMTREEAHAAIDAMLVGHAMGAAGARVVIEDFLDGEEASFIVMVDGRNVLPLASSQDHKRLRDGDRGPNTGGMGAYSPAPVVTPALHARIMREVILPTVDGMAADGIPYTGFLYAGVMIDAAGNPEGARVQLPPRRSRDAADHGAAQVRPRRSRSGTRSTARSTASRPNGTAARRSASCSPRAGYPDASAQGRRDRRPRRSTSAHPDCKVFHAGTALDGEHVVVSGGRVLCVTALGDSVRQAQRAAYAAIAGIHFDGMQYRTDIGHRALRRAQGLSAGMPRATRSAATPTVACTCYSTCRQRIVAGLEAIDGSRSAATNGRAPKAAAASRG